MSNFPKKNSEYFMKKSIVVILMMTGILASSVISVGQDHKPGFSPLVDNYLLIKNALVNSDATNTTAGSKTFITLVNELDTKNLSEAEQAVFENTQKKLLAAANILVASNDLVKQRAAFQNLSDNMIKLVKAARPSSALYVDFCPMKKAYWLSESKEIKNPYYGSAMLSCGTVTDSLK